MLQLCRSKGQAVAWKWVSNKPILFGALVSCVLLHLATTEVAQLLRITPLVHRHGDRRQERIEILKHGQPWQRYPMIHDGCRLARAYQLWM